MRLMKTSRGQLLLSCVAFVSLLGGPPDAAEAGPILYGITFGDQLVQIDPATGAGTVIGPLDSDMLAFGIANRGGDLYAYDQVADLIQQIDPATGHTLASISIGAGDLIAEGDLTFRADGVGFLAPASRKLYQFDITTGMSTLITSTLPLNIDGLAFDAAGVLYAFTDFTSSNVLTIDPTTGASTIVGSHGVVTPRGKNLGGLSFDASGILYAVIGDGLYTIDPATGAATLIGPITGVSGVSGIAFADTAAIPEPGAILLLGYGLTVVAGRMKRRACATTPPTTRHSNWATNCTARTVGNGTR
jgi:outer membrane protein assembly factor BamB